MLAPRVEQVVYRYDGSFAGFLCCVFTAIAEKQQPLDILPFDRVQLSLLPEREIFVVQEQAERVYRSLAVKMSRAAKEFVEQAFFCKLEQKELLLLDFFRQGYRYGRAVLNRLTDPTVATLMAAVKHLQNEIHRFKMFVRFADYEGILAAKMEPKNDVLPFLVEHFTNRFPNEVLFLYDESYKKALIYRPYEATIVPMEDFVFEEESREEKAYQQLWQTFYDTIAIEGRINENARRNHMPKWYWKNITEMRGQS